MEMPVYVTGATTTHALRKAGTLHSRCIRHNLGEIEGIWAGLAG